jgi:sec-independent protein translocase protein TatA
MIAMLSDSTLLIVALVFVVLFGGSQLPKLARNVGVAGKEFRKAQAEADAEAAAAKAEAAAPVAPAAAIPVVPPAIPAATVVTPADDRVTLSKSELEALLDEREARARKESSAS